MICVSKDGQTRYNINMRYIFCSCILSIFSQLQTYTYKVLFLSNIIFKMLYLKYYYLKCIIKKVNFWGKRNKVVWQKYICSCLILWLDLTWFEPYQDSIWLAWGEPLTWLELLDLFVLRLETCLRLEHVWLAPTSDIYWKITRDLINYNKMSLGTLLFFYIKSKMFCNVTFDEDCMILIIIIIISDFKCKIFKVYLKYTCNSSTLAQ